MQFFSFRDVTPYTAGRGSCYYERGCSTPPAGEERRPCCRGLRGRHYRKCGSTEQNPHIVILRLNSVRRKSLKSVGQIRSILQNTPDRNCESADLQKY